VYYIITNNKEIYDFAKKKGASVLSTTQSVIIESDENDTCFDLNSSNVDEFLLNFGNIDINSLGARCLKYILATNMNVNGDLRKTVYPEVADHFGTNVNAVTRAICCTHRKCMSKFSNESIRNFFSGQECCMYYSPLRSFEFIRLCKRYLDKNCLKYKS